MSSKLTRPAILLLPNLLHKLSTAEVLSINVFRASSTVDGILAESEKGAKLFIKNVNEQIRLLRRLPHYRNLEEIPTLPIIPISSMIPKHLIPESSSDNTETEDKDSTSSPTTKQKKTSNEKFSKSKEKSATKATEDTLDNKKAANKQSVKHDREIEAELKEFFSNIKTKKERWAILSDAGVPVIADPGSSIVHRAHQMGVHVEVFPGPSALFMALMLSGLPAQRFAFHGYLTKPTSGANQNQLRIDEIRQLERRSRDDDATQLFMEAAYRNIHVFNDCIRTLRPDTLLSVVWDLTSPISEGCLTLTVRQWQQSGLLEPSNRTQNENSETESKSAALLNALSLEVLLRRQCVFLLYSPSAHKTYTQTHTSSALESLFEPPLES